MMDRALELTPGWEEPCMIWVTRLDGTRMMVNAELVETLEATPDTVLTLTNGRKLLVLESVEEVASRVVEYRQRVYGRRRPSKGVGRSSSAGECP